MQFLFILLASIAGFGIAWFIYTNKLRSINKQMHNFEKQLLEDKSSITAEKIIVEERLRQKNEDLEQTKAILAQNLLNNNTLFANVATLENENKNLREKLESQLQETESLQKKLTTEFENIANRIMKERSAEFSTHNQESIQAILNPLKEKIQGFERKVEDTFEKDLRDRISLSEEVKKLTQLNTRVSEEANNLTRALKGDVKKQGNWGEVILERVLERSGLTKGQEYTREVLVKSMDDSILRPDVIVQLPDEKHIIIDSKVSLVAYERYVSANDEAEQAQALKEHLNSIRSHIKLLSDKSYQNAQTLNTPDFVLMFMPIEGSFMTAVQSDNEIFANAWDKNIVIVSPSTLLATLRTVASIWKQENQTRNAQEIARLSGALYDKFIGFSEDMIKIKNNIDRTSEAYNEAFKKMKEGNGNIVRTAERIKELGAKTSNKKLPEALKDL